MSELKNGMNANAPCLSSDEKPTCPVCGEECEIYFMNEADIVGCEHCVRRISARDNQWATVY